MLAYTDESLFEACGVRIAFTQRSGGVSQGAFDSLNLGAHVNDDAAAVQANRETVLSAFEVPGAQIICPKQVHGADVAVCAAAADVSDAQEFAAEGADAVVVTCDDVAGLLCFADCMPLITVAPNGAFAVAHCGWRGVVGFTWRCAIEALCEETGADPSELNVYIGPYIHACHFEVGEEVAQQFELLFGDACLVDARHVDMGAAIRVGLASLGIDARRIADVDICTVCDDGHRFYSYRATDGACGRHGAFAVRCS